MSFRKQAKSVNRDATKASPDGQRTKAFTHATIWLLLWGLLSHWDPTSLLIGLPSVALATWVSLRLGRRNRAMCTANGLALTRLPRFTLFFLRESILGGFDVARRALAPSPRLAPGFFHHTPTLRSESARLLFINCVSLMPGTLTARLDDGELLIHSLDTDADPLHALDRLQREIGLLFQDPGAMS